MEMLYETSATVTHEGRNGSVRTADGLLDVRLAMPKELGGAGGATNPEQLFACGYSACFTSAILKCARESKLKIGNPSVTAHVGLAKVPDGSFQLAATLDVALPDVSREDAEALARSAHGICPYSRATRNNVDVKIRLVGWKESTDADAFELS
jgi:osmotically inducible protein OsmC